MTDGALQVFRCRTIVVAGVVNLVLGVAVLAAAGVIDTRLPGDDGAAIVLVVLGLLLLVLGAGRLTARLEVHDTCLVWVSLFKPNKVPLASLTNASLNRAGAGPNGVAAVALAAPQLWGFDLALFTLWRLLAPASGRVHVLYLHGEDGRLARAPAVCTHRFDYSFSDAAKATGAVSDAIVRYHRKFGASTHTQWGAGGVVNTGVYGQGGWDSVGVERAGALPPGPASYGPDPATGLRPPRPVAAPDPRPFPYATPVGPAAPAMPVITPPHGAPAPLPAPPPSSLPPSSLPPSSLPPPPPRPFGNDPPATGQP